MPSGASLERVLDHLLDNFGRTRGDDTGHDPQASMELASNASRSSRDASWRLELVCTSVQFDGLHATK